MGSIEVFPRKRNGPKLSEAWRNAPLRGSGAVKVRAAALEDYAAIRALRRCAQPGLECTLKQFESQRAAFPEGQLVAECEGEVVGASSSLVVQWGEFSHAPTWQAVTGEGCFSTHDIQGGTLYGAETLVDVTRRGFGAGRALYAARRKLCRKLNLQRIIGTARLPGYDAAGDAMQPEQYVQGVIWGDIDDPILRFQMSQGYHLCAILEDYLPADHESAGHAALLVWLNPLYSPPGPRAFETQRPRKCA